MTVETVIVPDAQTTIISSRLSKLTKDKWNKHVDNLWTKLRQESAQALNKGRHEKDSATAFTAYKSVREELYLVASLAVACDYEKRLEILDQWADLQETFLNRTVGALRQKKTDLEQIVQVGKAEVDELEINERKVREKLASLVTSGQLPTKEDIEQLSKLQQKIATRQQSRDEFARYDNAFKNIDAAVAGLTELTALPKAEKIHHVILSPETILDQLQNGSYTGLPLEPFELIAVTQKPIVDLVRTTPAHPTSRTTLFVNPKEKPKELIALLEIKRVVDSYASGKRFTGGDVLEALPGGSLFSNKLIRAYLQAGAPVFNVEEEDRTTSTYRFVKLDLLPKGEEEFLREMFKVLKPAEQSGVHEFYIKRALDAIREDPQIGYEPFTVKDVNAKLREIDGIELDGRGIGLHLGSKYGSNYGVRAFMGPASSDERERERKFEFVEVIPTDEHKRRLAAGIQAWGYAEFNANNLCRIIRQKELGTPLHCRVIDTLLQTSAETFGVRKTRDAPEPHYQTLARPQTATALVEAQRASAEQSLQVDSLV